jgi:hypothetical protein
MLHKTQDGLLLLQLYLWSNLFVLLFGNPSKKQWNAQHQVWLPWISLKQSLASTASEDDATTF